MVRNTKRVGDSQIKRQATPLEQFFTRLRKTPRTWSLKRGNHWLRSNSFCPITSLTKNHEEMDYIRDGLRIGLTVEDARAIANADDAPYIQCTLREKQLQQRLLRACGLSPRATKSNATKRKKK